MWAEGASAVLSTGIMDGCVLRSGCTYINLMPTSRARVDSTYYCYLLLIELT